ncbi:MAG: MEMO1 family protein [Thermoplasmata archaeon]
MKESTASIRKPVVAGTFYPSDPKTLRYEIENCFRHRLGAGTLPALKKGKRSIKGGVAPHAGYIYSGPVASHLYHALAEDGFPEVFIIIGPNHTGYGSSVSVTTETFQTPLGEVTVDTGLAEKLTKGIIKEDQRAHVHEHSIEVQLPFLQYIKQDIKFVPICMMDQSYETAVELGKIISNVIKGKDAVVIASTDFSHYVPNDEAYKKDKLAIDAIISRDAAKLESVVHQHDISMCGYGPVMAMLVAVGGEKAALLKYATSGDVAPMYDVVGYGALVVQ